jgi:hypothetical protein
MKLLSPQEWMMIKFMFQLFEYQQSYYDEFCIYLHNWNIFRIFYILSEVKFIQTLITVSQIQKAFTHNFTNPSYTSSMTSSTDITTSTGHYNGKKLLCDFYIPTAFTNLFSIYSYGLYRSIYLVMSHYSCSINKLEWSYLNCILLHHS